MTTMQRFFDGHAPKWDGYQRPFDFEMVRRIIDRIAPGPADCVLDVGCGTGILVPFLAEKGVEQYLGMDISTGMAGEFRKKFPQLPVVVADFAQENLQPERFSLVIIFNAFPHFEDEGRVFSRAFRVLQPGGRLVIAHSMNREKLDEHHRKAGVAVEGHVLISDSQFLKLYKDYGFREVTVADTDHFFSCGRVPSQSD